MFPISTIVSPLQALAGLYGHTKAWNNLVKVPSVTDSEDAEQQLWQQRKEMTFTDVNWLDKKQGKIMFNYAWLHG